MYFPPDFISENIQIHKREQQRKLSYPTLFDLLIFAILFWFLLCILFVRFSETTSKKHPEVCFNVLGFCLNLHCFPLSPKNIVLSMFKKYFKASFKVFYLWLSWRGPPVLTLCKLDTDLGLTSDLIMNNIVSMNIYQQILSFVPNRAKAGKLYPQPRKFIQTTLATYLREGDKEEQ